MPWFKYRDQRTNSWESFHHGTCGDQPRMSRLNGEHLYPLRHSTGWTPILFSLLIVSFTAGKIEIDIVFNIF